jgi:hypothetical protein
VPCVATQAGTRILERLELQARGWNADCSTILEQPFSIGGNQVGHRTTLPDMSMEPESAVHGVDHSLAPRAELFEERRRPTASLLFVEIIAIEHA